MTSIERGASNTALKTIHESISQAEQAMRNARTIIKAQAARIAELEEYVARLERVIKRTHAHVVADHKAIALNILRSNIAYITEKEKGQHERHDDQDVSTGSESRPDYGPAARGKSQAYYDNAAERLKFIWKEGQRPELELAFTQERRGVRYLKLIEQLGEDATTFRAWWTDTRQ